MTVLIRIIRDYLQTHKRLVVPQLGAFLVREEPYAVLFSELIRRDDGVLQALLVDHGMTEIAARGEIDRFIYEVRHAVQQGESFHLSDFGVMHPGPNDTIVFEYHTRLSIAPEVPVDIIPDLIEKLREEPKRPERVESKPVEPTAPVSTPAVEQEEPESGEEDDFEFEEVEKRSPAEPAESVKSVRVAASDEADRTDDDEDFEEDFEESVAARPRRVPRKRPAQAAKKRPDYFMILAIVVAAIALLAIAFGAYSNAQAVDESEEEYIERVEIDPAMVEAAGGGEE